MFPEITREDVFRLETRRLWLRWPTAADAVAGPDLAKSKLPEAAAGDPYRLKDAATVERMHRENAAGAALHLVLTKHGADRRPVGTVSLSAVRERIENCGLLIQVGLAESHRGAGLMTEAVQAVVDAAFMLSDTPLVAASSRVLDPAFRRVLEKCGFAFCGTGLDTGSAGGGLVASDRFRLDRKAWACLKTWRVPGVVKARSKPVSAGQPC